MPAYLTTREVAKSLRLSQERIFQLVRERRIPAIRLSAKVIRFDPDAIAEALDAMQNQEVKP